MCASVVMSACVCASVVMSACVCVCVLVCVVRDTHTLKGGVKGALPGLDILTLFATWRSTRGLEAFLLGKLSGTL